MLDVGLKYITPPISFGFLSLSMATLCLSNLSFGELKFCGDRRSMALTTLQLQPGHTVRSGLWETGLSPPAVAHPVAWTEC